MADPAPERSWWTTLPGILTGLAALLTAVTGLVVALVQVANRSSEAGRTDPARRDTPAIAVPATPPNSGAAPSGGVAPPRADPAQQRVAPQAPAASSQPGGPPPLTLGERLTIADATFEVLSVEISPPRNDRREISVTFRATAGETVLSLWRDNVRIFSSGRINVPVEAFTSVEIRPGARQQLWVRFEIPEPVRDPVLSFTESWSTPRGEVRRALAMP